MMLIDIEGMMHFSFWFSWIAIVPAIVIILVAILTMLCFINDVKQRIKEQENK